MLAIGYNRFFFEKRMKTSLTVTNQQLKELNASKDKFFTIIAHDLSNPLSALNNLSRALIENYRLLNEEQLLNYLTNQKKSASHLKGLLENLLKWALSQTKNLHEDLKEIELSEVIKKKH